MNEFQLVKRTFYPSRVKSLLFLLLTSVFVVIGVFMIVKGEGMGWLVAGFFGFGVIVFIVNMLPQAAYLTLDAEGFVTCSLFRKHRYNWEDISYFGVGKISHNTLVMFNFSPQYQKAKKIRKVSSALAGAEGALHDNFGFKAEELAELMNRYKMESERAKMFKNQ